MIENKKFLSFSNSRRMLSDLVPVAWNPRRLTEKQAADLKKSLEKFDLAEVPVINTDNTIIAGHQRVKILYSLHGDEEIDVRVPNRALTDAEVKEYNIRSNKNTGEFDYDALANNFDVDDLLEWGFTDSEFQIGDTAEQLPEGDENEVPEPPKEPITVLGDLYEIGEHRLICGDSISADAIEKLMNGKQADMVFTDPPYNADYCSRVDKDRRKPWGGILNDNMSPEDFDEFLADIIGILRILIKEKSAIYICIDWKRYPQLVPLFNKAFTHKATIVWNKKNFGLGTYYRTQYELILFGVLGEKLGTWNSGHDERDVWDMDREKVGSYVHPTQKPVALIERAIKNTSANNDCIADLFLGSGTTMIAAHKTNRICYGMELSPQYCDVIVKRIHKAYPDLPIKRNGEQIDMNQFEQK